MNILIISTSDLRGGAAIAAYRLMNALKAEGENVKMAVSEKLSDSSDVFVVGSKRKNRYNFYKERATIFLNNRLSRKNLFDVSIANTGVSVTNLKEFREADIIHLHWINQGMLSLGEIEKILKSGKKVIWTMHDMWPFTGICHHSEECNKYEQDCGNCPYLKSRSANDLSKKVYKKKQRVYSKRNITFVACSNWLKELALKSPLTSGHRVVSIPNPIDTEVYHPLDKKGIRKKLNLPADKKIILYAAMKASDPRKGTKYLIEAANSVARKNYNNILYIIVGNKGEEIAEKLPANVLNIGFADPKIMPDLYSASDLYITPSLQENLPNTLMEAMACGTPCVGFNIGGIPEMIIHKENGYVAKYKDSEDFANGIIWSLFEADYSSLSERAREKVVADYNQSKIAKQYLEQYTHNKE